MMIGRLILFKEFNHDLKNLALGMVKIYKDLGGNNNGSSI